MQMIDVAADDKNLTKLDKGEFLASANCVLQQTIQDDKNTFPLRKWLGRDVELVYSSKKSAKLVFGTDLVISLLTSDDKLSAQSDTNWTVQYQTLPLVYVNQRHGKFKKLKIAGDWSKEADSKFILEKMNDHQGVYWNDSFAFIGDLDEKMEPTGQGVFINPNYIIETFTRDGEDLVVNSLSLAANGVLRKFRYKKGEKWVKSDTKMTSWNGISFESEADFQQGRLTVWHDNQRYTAFGNLCEDFIIQDDEAANVMFESGEKRFELRDTTTHYNNKPNYVTALKYVINYI